MENIEKTKARSFAPLGDVGAVGCGCQCSRGGKNSSANSSGASSACRCMCSDGQSDGYSDGESAK
ncbi:MAG TPA: hypothetical protein VK469_23460 [Candidatus Kapabacteria bacterium]|nr:hypothetical protein [Candidatus Kapabacteria bacterium]